MSKQLYTVQRRERIRKVLEQNIEQEMSIGELAKQINSELPATYHVTNRDLAQNCKIVCHEMNIQVTRIHTMNRGLMYKLEKKETVIIQ